tara:strand:+ start:301 stop:1758 length:1458 start_codon:yes stop_codon:yes gene_type:complete
MRLAVLAVLFGALILSGVGASNAQTLTDADVRQYVADPIYNNLWFGLYSTDDEKYGWWNGNEYRKGDYWIFEEASEIWFLDQIEDGGRRYEERIIIRQSTKEYFDIRNSFVLSRIESVTQFGDEIRKTSAIVDSGNIFVEVDHGEESFNFDVEGFSLSLHDIYAPVLLLRKYSDWKVGDEIEYQYYDPDTFKVSVETDIITEIGTSFREGLPLDFYRVKTKQSATRSSFEAFLTTRGLPLRYVEATGYAVLEEETIAREGLSFGGASFQDSIVQIDRSLPSAGSLDWIKIRIVGNYKGGIYSGYQQQIIYEGDQTYLLLGKDVGSPEIANAVERVQNLSETANYPIESNVIQKMVADALGGASSEWEKIEKLVSYVDRFIVDDLSANSLNVFEIIQKRRGDCSEHALLFNTMARAARIPAREVRGLVHFSDKEFGLHAWNEVLVNEVWHAVDATWNKTEIPITHIKFSANRNVLKEISFNLIEMQ